MAARKLTIIDEKLIQLKHQGFCVIERWEILSEHPSRERITDAVWGDIKDRYLDMIGSQEQNRNIMLVKCDDTTTVQKFVLVDPVRVSEI
jgi:hypothetical protein